MKGELIAEIDAMIAKKVKPTDYDFICWKSKMYDYISNIFGNDSAELLEFTRIAFEPTQITVAQAYDSNYLSSYCCCALEKVKKIFK